MPDLKALTKIFISNTREPEEEEEQFLPEPEDMEESSTNSWIPNIWNNAVKEDPWLPSMTKQQRLMGFMGCLFGGSLCFGLSLIYLPFVLIKARKFVLLYTLGSVFTMSSFSMLWGPWNHLQHLVRRDRLPFTAAYLSSLILTVYTAMVLKSTLLTVVCAAAQFVALLWYVFSYVPGGITGLKFFSKLFSKSLLKTAKSTLPI